MPRSLDITSTKNPLIRRIRALLDPEARKAEARMVVEGVRMLEEVLDAGVPVEVLVYDPHALAGPRGEALLDRARRHGARLVTAAPHVVAACSQVDTPQGVVAVVERSPAALSDLLNVDGLVVVGGVALRLCEGGRTRRMCNGCELSIVNFVGFFECAIDTPHSGERKVVLYFVRATRERGWRVR